MNKDLNNNEISNILLKNICTVKVNTKSSDVYTPEVVENKYIPCFLKPDTEETIKAGATKVLNTGFNLVLEKGYEAMVRSVQTGLTVETQYLYHYNTDPKGIKVTITNNTKEDILLNDETPYAEIHFVRSCLPEIT